MDDLIKRNDAIEAIEIVDWYHQNRNKDMVSGANSDEHQAWYKADDVYKALEAVPSADRKRRRVMWRDEPATEKQLRYCQEIYEHSEYHPPKFEGTTKGEASDYIDKHAKLAHESLWAIEHGY